MRIETTVGPTDTFLDVEGLSVGNAHDVDVCTGVTVIIPDEPVAMGVDVRGGGPGTRDTEALDPTCLVEKVHGLVLSGGSVFGLAAADAVTEALSKDGVGLPIGPKPVPVVPSAILFDLANGGDKNWDASPYPRLAKDAYGARTKSGLSEGPVGAGFGARAGGVPGGLGTASLKAGDLTVSVLVAVNSFGVVGNVPGPSEAIDLPKTAMLGGNTTIAAVATNVALDKAGCKRLAIMAQDGLARSIRPIHTPYDGDTVFALSTGAHSSAQRLAHVLTVLGTLASDCLMKAVQKATQAANC